MNHKSRRTKSGQHFHRGSIHSLTRGLVGMISLLFLLSARAEDHYTFRKVADSSAEFSDFGVPSVNQSGTVAFLAALAAGGSGIYRSSNGVVSAALLSGTQGVVSFGTGPTPVNSAGRVGFLAFLANGRNAVCTFGDEGFFVRAVGGVDAQVFPPDLAISINDTDMAAFHALTIDGHTAVYRNNSPVYQSFSTYFGEIEGLTVALNNPMLVAFEAVLRNPNIRGIVRASGAPGVAPVRIAVEDVFRFSPGGPIAMNSLGWVVFGARLRDASQTNGIFKGNGGAVLTVALVSPPGYASFDSPSIDSGANVCFQATLATGGTGLFTGEDPTLNRVVRVGDSLFGSTVVDVKASGTALNDGGNIAFKYRLANGLVGIALATPKVVVTSIARSGASLVTIVGNGLPGRLHSLQATNSLTQPFAAVASVQAGPDGALVFDETVPSNTAKRFYRFTLP